MSRRVFLGLFFAFTLVFAGSAAQLHSLAHAQADLAEAVQGQKAPAPLKHATDQCLVVHALDGAAAEPGTQRVAEITSSHVVARVVARRGESPAAAYRSRAPPLLS